MMPIQLEHIMTEPTALALRPHHGYRSWTTTWYDATGARRTKRFGKETELTRSAARAAYRAWLDQWHERPEIRNPEGDPDHLTVAGLADAFLHYARLIYTAKDGTVSGHLSQVESAMAALHGAHGSRPASALEASDIARLRDSMIRGVAKETLARKTVNGRLQIIKQAYAWAREKGWISREVAYDVALVRPLAKGRSEARDSEKIEPVSFEIVSQTKLHLTPLLCDMIDLLWLTGMRPGELCMMRGCDIETGGDIWIYRPASHKTEHKDKLRQVALGPKAQEILKTYLTTRTTAYLFSPIESERQRREAATKARKTPLGYGNGVGTNVKRRPLRMPGERYSSESLRKAIHYACKVVEKKLRKENTAAMFEYWNPNQIRHSWATRMRAEFGLEAASDGLGHASVNTTLIYAERSLERAKDVARKAG